MGSRASFPAWLSRHVLLAEHATALNHRAQSILPDRQFAHGHNAQFARRANMPHAIALAASGKSRAHFRASRGLEEGRFAIVTNVGSGMRWTRPRVRRSSRPRTEKSCGSGAPTQALRSRNPPRPTVATKHGHREEHEGPR